MRPGSRGQQEEGQLMETTKAKKGKKWGRRLQMTLML